MTPSELSVEETPDTMANYETKGFSKCGFGGEVLVYGREKDSKYIAGMINNFCSLLIKGDRFDPNRVHYIHNHECHYHFRVLEYPIPLYGRVKYQLIPIKD